MLRMTVLALLLIWPSNSAAQPTTPEGLDKARADVARFCAAEIQNYVKARKVEAGPNAKKSPEQEVFEVFEHLLGRWSSPPDLNLMIDIKEHADALTRRRGQDPDVWLTRIMAEDRLRICVNGRAIRHYGELETYVVLQNKTASTAKLMSGSTNWGEIGPGENKLYRFARALSMTFRISVNDVDAYGPAVVKMTAGQTVVLTFGERDTALSVAQPPSLD